MRTRFALAVVGVVATTLGIASCRDPTQITLEITTDLPCSTVLANGGVVIRVGSPANVEGDLAQQVEARTCVNGRVGSLVIVPSDAVDDQVAIFVAEGASAKSATCSRQSPTGCILARRVLRYVPHTPLQLPIELSASCIDKPCAPGETCNKGQCRSDTVACNGGICDVPPGDAGVVDAAPDASCNTCGGTTCVDLTTSLSHCGACNLVCQGECKAGICRLVTTAAMPAEGTTKGCLGIAGTPPEVFWSMQRTQVGNSAVHAVDRAGGTPVTLEPQINDLGGLAAGVGHVVYGVTTGNIAVIHSAKSGSHTFDANLGSVISGGHVTAVGRSAVTDQACWTTIVDQSLRCTAWGSKVAAQGGEFIALSPGVVAVGGLGNGVQFADLATGTTATFNGAGAGVRGIAARLDQDVFYATQGPALTLITVKPNVQPAFTPIDTLAHPGIGIAFDAPTESIYWVEDDGNGIGTTSIHQRPLSVTGTQRTIATGQLGASCIAVDDQAVYWLSGGVPYRAPK